MAKSRHNQIAKRLANKLGAEYNPGKGPDIQTPNQVIEVETEVDGVSDALRQLSGFKRPRYIALPTAQTEAAKDRTKSLKVGIMDEFGNVVKRARKPGARKA